MEGGSRGSMMTHQVPECDTLVSRAVGERRPEESDTDNCCSTSPQLAAYPDTSMLPSGEKLQL